VGGKASGLVGADGSALVGAPPDASLLHRLTAAPDGRLLGQGLEGQGLPGQDQASARKAKRAAGTNAKRVAASNAKGVRALAAAALAHAAAAEDTSSLGFAPDTLTDAKPVEGRKRPTSKDTAESKDSLESQLPKEARAKPRKRAKLPPKKPSPPEEGQAAGDREGQAAGEREGQAAGEREGQAAGDQVPLADPQPTQPPATGAGGAAAPSSRYVYPAVLYIDKPKGRAPGAGKGKPKKPKPPSKASVAKALAASGALPHAAGQGQGAAPTYGPISEIELENMAARLAKGLATEEQIEDGAPPSGSGKAHSGKAHSGKASAAKPIKPRLKPAQPRKPRAKAPVVPGTPASEALGPSKPQAGEGMADEAVGERAALPPLTIREMLADKELGTPMSAEMDTSVPKDKRSKAARPPPLPLASLDTQDASKVAAPQLRTVGGRIVMDTSSLVITNPIDKSYELSDVVHDQTGRGANAWSKKRKHCDRWSSDETDKFYLGLRKFGSDFTIIAHWLGDRRDDRRHVRNKFKKEEKVNPLRIQRALAQRLTAEDDDWAAVRLHSGVTQRQSLAQGEDNDDAEAKEGDSKSACQDADKDKVAQVEEEIEEAVDLGEDDAPFDDDDDMDD